VTGVIDVIKSKKINDSNLNVHEGYMEMALELAEIGRGRTSPNPMVGCVIVKNGKIISRGYHRQYGDLHAEAEAIRNCSESLKGTTAYVTLEPCSHRGKQPPCCEALISAGISQVIYASEDPNPMVSGRGIKYLEDNGVKTTGGILKKEAEELNKFFFHHMRTGLPFVRIKTAVTADGAQAMEDGTSKWMTGEESRMNVHKDRGYFSAVMTGIGTVLRDDPLLTSRIPGSRNPIRIILDRDFKIPVGSELIKTVEEAPLIIVTSEKSLDSDPDKLKLLGSPGIRIITVNLKEGRIDLENLMEILGKEKINSIYTECGGELSFSLLSKGMVSEYEVYTAPKILGGKNSRRPVTGRGFSDLSEALELKLIETEMHGSDLRTLYKVINHKEGKEKT